jgi:hypothetical protein
MKYSYPECGFYDRKLNLCSTMELMKFESRAAYNNIIAPLVFFVIMLIIHAVISITYYTVRRSQIKVKIIKFN